MGFYELGALLAFLITATGLSWAMLENKELVADNFPAVVISVTLAVTAATFMSWAFILFAAVFGITKYIHTKHKGNTK